jgi:diguanylate cyclase (GGDEF)-like protein
MRISKNAFTNLAIFMIGFGVLIGLAFPFAVLAAGVPATTALSWNFFSFTISAGVLVGGVNILLARLLVRPRLALVARGMRKVEEGLKAATYSGDWSKCDPDDCALPVDSDDEFGAAAAAFNRLLQALAESHTVETRISDFTAAMSAELDVTAICQAAIDSFRNDLGAAGVAILGDLDGELTVLASHGITGAEALPRSDLVRSAVRSLHPDSMTIPEDLVIDAAIATIKARQVVVHPLVLESTAIGAVVLASSAELPAGARALGSLFVSSLSVALSNALSHESIRRIASLDGLTGIHNRSSGLTRLEQEYRRARHLERPIGLIMADIDRFKQINDTHGHLIGDSVIRRVAGLIEDSLRSDDFVMRYGGEEFLAVLPGAGSDHLDRISERIRSRVESEAIAADGVEMALTLSLGFASSSDPAAGDDATTLVAQADEALLAAKRMGRNRVVAAAAVGA